VTGRFANLTKDLNGNEALALKARVTLLNAYNQAAVVAAQNSKPIIEITDEMMDVAAWTMEERGMVPYGVIANPVGAGHVIVAALTAGGFDVRVPKTFRPDR
jgi:hypothetical protein